MTCIGKFPQFSWTKFNFEMSSFLIVKNSPEGSGMSLAWVLFIVAAILVLVGAGWWRRKRLRSRPARYVDTPAWRQEHWQEEHDRERAARQHLL
jgi:hypothetical protein